MSDITKNGDSELRVEQRENSPPAQRITEAEFQARSSEWLREASNGRQIIVVDEQDRKQVKMVVGMNGVVFNIPDPLSEMESERKVKAKKEWLD